MLQTYKSYTRRTLAMLLAVLVAVGALFSGSFPAVFRFMQPTAPSAIRQVPISLTAAILPPA